MDIILYYTISPYNKLEKDLTDAITLTGSLKNESSIVTPTILIQSDADIIQQNYAYIAAFERYYFITDFISVRNNIFELHLKSDVLMSFKNGIKHSTAIIERSAEFDKSTPYLNAPGFVPQVKRKTDIIQFSNGFNEDGEFILLTAGGFAT